MSTEFTQDLEIYSSGVARGDAGETLTASLRTLGTTLNNVVLVGQHVMVLQIQNPTGDQKTAFAYGARMTQTLTTTPPPATTVS